MSSPLETAEALWQTQLAAMRAAIADLNLPPKTINGDTVSPALDIDFDEDEDLTSGNSGDDVWDFISDSEGDSHGSDFDDGPISAADAAGYGPQWLKSKCVALAARKQGLSGED